ncbi:uncharacterized protein PHACADRAFT_210937 [Phanerochaete carnosa HHB-10118-sp]|uniref:Uncharacterized protein n=1 Tax=Phanerochaete carnosa (strain HHB-10118-sp) TaxID=650164 RepID=K5UTG6_PHACS|nr:uncharacterized protein PHACADRAFT_210937 [Phanerochaete carnosa HHB-10118-sp]EKM53246.1 hypothetical protein PHACADRAFT_210937 [Phanerochaete carnosa HHB-10118-sp]
MQFKLGSVLLATVVAFVGYAAASPIEVRDAGGNLFVCTNANWGSDCTNIGFSDGQCVVFPSGFQNDVSAIGPPSGWVCTAFVNSNSLCVGDGLGDITFPGYADLGSGHTNYNDRLNSFRCSSE